MAGFYFLQVFPYEEAWTVRTPLPLGGGPKHPGISMMETVGPKSTSKLQRSTE